MKISLFQPLKTFNFFLIFISGEMEISGDTETLTKSTSAFDHYSIAFW